MNVRCSRCTTEYEFDDALVSDRGTTVRCTNCGHQFKVFADRAHQQPERWVVLAPAGERIFESVAQLQQAIADGHIGSRDLLVRGREAPRPIGSIAELAAFIGARANATAARTPPRSLPGLAAADHPELAERPLASAPVTPKPLPPAPGSDFRTPQPSYSGEDGPSSGLTPALAQPRRAHSRFIAAIVLLGMLALLAGTVGKKYLLRIAAPALSSAPAATASAEVGDLLARARGAQEKGELDAARAALDKARSLAPEHPEVLGALAELDIARADLLWIGQRLSLDQTPATEQQKKLAAELDRARSAVERAGRVAGGASVALARARIDLHRMRGELDRARSLVEPLSAQPTSPQNAYVLAALDLSHEEPVWSTVIERLYTAAAAERGPGRARPLLIYALVRAGKVKDAALALEKLASRTPSHPLRESLSAFVERQRPSDAGPSEAPVAVAAERGKRAPRAPEATASDAATIAAARAALERGDYEVARRGFWSVVEQNPGHPEALAGLAEVARRKGEESTAQNLYTVLLEKNPSYVPALMARADHKWNSGDHEGAVALYRQVLDRAGPSSSEGQRAAERIVAHVRAKQEAAAPESAPPGSGSETEPSE